MPDSTDRLPDALAPERRRLLVVAVVAVLVGAAGARLLAPPTPPATPPAADDETTVSAGVLDARTPTPVSPTGVAPGDSPSTVATLSQTRTRRPTRTPTTSPVPTPTPSPSSTPTPSPSPTPTPTPSPTQTATATPLPTPDRGPGIVILTVQADAPGPERENLADELVVFHNPGRRPLRMGNWTVADADGHRYRFPPRATVAGGGTVTLHTGRGRDGPRHRYWNRSTPVWNNAGDVVTVRDADGDVRARRAYGDAAAGVELFGRDRVPEGVAMDPGVARERMVARLQRLDRVERPETAAALESVPRHEFLSGASVEAAYADRPRPIDAGQTISAPHAVAWITDLLELSPGDRVLEVGTGCGYHAAVTAAVVDRTPVYSVEYHEKLARAARERFDRLGYDVRVRVGDGHDGWPDHAPYDAAYLTCAPPAVPRAVIEQVRPGGRVVAPVGTGSQRLVRLHVEANGVRREEHGGVRFVEMAGSE